MGFYYFFQKSLFAENYFAIAVINLTTPGPLYTCLVMTWDGSLVGRAGYGKFFENSALPVTLGFSRVITQEEISHWLCLGKLLG